MYSYFESLYLGALITNTLLCLSLIRLIIEPKVRFELSLFTK